MGKSFTKKERRLMRHIDERTGKPRGYSEGVALIAPGVRNAMLRIARRERRNAE